VDGDVITDFDGFQHYLDTAQELDRMSEPDFFLIAKALQPYASLHRRHLHMYPELAFNEIRTSAYVAHELEKLGMEVRRGVGKTGLVANFPGNKEGPRFLLRFDMDALAVEEKSGVEFASIEAGLMHACGHDGHVAIGLTIASILAELGEQLEGSYFLVFQPAEEIGQGAAAMIADGVMDIVQPDYALAVHLWSEKPVGWLGITAGPVMAGCKDVSFKVRGVGEHGARPHLAVDPILASAHLITALQSITSRETDPLQSLVYSITRIQAGTNNNVIPDMVTLGGKPRYFTKEVGDMMEKSTRRISKGIADTFGCEIEVEFGAAVLPVVNNQAAVQAAWKAAQKMDADFEVDQNMRMMASEDMAMFLDLVPGAMIFVGSGSDDPTKRFPLHHPCFDIDEDSLVVAAALLLGTCQQLAKR